MNHKNLNEFLYGKEFSEKLENVYGELLEIESQHEEIFTKENQLHKYLLISYDPENFDIKFRYDLPKGIQNKIVAVKDKYFK